MRGVRAAAREMGENATLSTRQLERWMIGDVGRPLPVSRRVAERFWGFPFEVLLGPAEVTPGALAAPIGGHLPSREIPTTKVGSGVDSRTLSEEIVMATEESARFVRRATWQVDQDVIDQLNADVRQLARDFLVRPPFAMFRPISLLRSEVFGLLDARQLPAYLPALYRVAGQLCGLLAHACADLGNPYASETPLEFPPWTGHPETRQRSGGRMFRCPVHRSTPRSSAGTRSSWCSPRRSGPCQRSPRSLVLTGRPCVRCV